MTVKLELKPEIEARLAAQAEAQGLSLESYLDQVLQTTAIAGGMRTRRRPKGRMSLAQLFADSPFRGLDLEFKRDDDTGRPPTL